MSFGFEVGFVFVDVVVEVFDFDFCERYWFVVV